MKVYAGPPALVIFKHIFLVLFHPHSLLYHQLHFTFIHLSHPSFTPVLPFTPAPLLTLVPSFIFHSLSLHVLFHSLNIVASFTFAPSFINVLVFPLILTAKSSNRFDYIINAFPPPLSIPTTPSTFTQKVPTTSQFHLGVRGCKNDILVLPNFRAQPPRFSGMIRHLKSWAFQSCLVSLFFFFKFLRI